jgi:hypothetical protein
MSGNGAMTKTDGAVTKPRALCGCAHMVVLLGTPLVSQLVVVIHYETMSMRYLGTICFFAT